MTIASRFVCILALLASFLAGAPAHAQCTHPLAPTSWQETCDQPTGTGAKLRIHLATHIDRDYFAINRSLIVPGFVTCSLNRVRYEFVAVQGASEFALDTFVSPVRATTHFLPPSTMFAVSTPVDSVMESEVPVPDGLITSQPWSLRIRAIGGALIQHAGCITSTIDFAADAVVTTDYLP